MQDHAIGAGEDLPATCAGIPVHRDAEPTVIDGEVLPDGVLDEDARTAAIGRAHRDSGRNPAAVPDPRQVAEIRRRMEHHRTPWLRRVLARWSR